MKFLLCRRFRLSCSLQAESFEKWEKLLLKATKETKPVICFGEPSLPSFPSVVFLVPSVPVRFLTNSASRKTYTEGNEENKDCLDLKRPSLPSFSSVEFLVPAQRLSVGAFSVKKLLRKKS
jgi:hypothetical protein